MSPAARRAPRSSSSPICRCGRSIEQWGWGTADAGRALGYLKRFGSVTVLNGHIHQIIQKVEGNVTFHTAASTAFPQPAPGTARSSGPDAGAGRRPAQIPRRQNRRLRPRQGRPGADRQPARRVKGRASVHVRNPAATAAAADTSAPSRRARCSPRRPPIAGAAGRQRSRPPPIPPPSRSTTSSSCRRP